MKKNKRFIKLLNITGLFLTIFIVSCQVEMPIKEMSQAKYTITEAVELKAEKYAPDDLKKGQEFLYKSHEFIQAGNEKKAKAEAEKSIKATEAAIEKTLPLLARDTLEEAKKLYSELDPLNAEKYSANEYSAAGDALKEADTLNSQNEFYDSYQKSLISIKNSKQAKANALANIPAMQKEIDRINSEQIILKDNRGEEFAQPEMEATRKSLTEANEQIQSGNLKEALVKINEADASLKAASEKTYSRLASENILVAETMIKKAEEHPNRAEFSGEIDKAKNLTAESKDLLEKKSYNDSINRSNEAISILNAVTIAMDKKADELKTQGETKQEIPGADKTETAEKIVEKTAEKTVEKIAGFPKEYTVQYNPKKRDCLWRISLTEYNDAKLWPLIYIANRDKIKDPDLIFPGQKFIIPDPAGYKKEELKEAVKEPIASPEAPKIDENPKTGDAEKPVDEPKPENEPKDTPVE